jgi:glutamate dehydrogenase/leucine dehydrogenase
VAAVCILYSGNPSIATARGVLRGLEAAFQFAGKSLVGSTLAVQGAGHVGIPLMQFAFNAGVKKIIASDVDSHRREQIQSLFVGFDFELKIVQKNDNNILFLNVDAVCPCATGGILNRVTIPNIQSRIVCGAANNQLDRMDADSKLMHEKGILYIPDFLVNRMGIVNCADEHMGVIDNDPNLDLHLGSEWENSIFRLTLNVLAQSKSAQRTMQEIAVEMANRRSLEVNPIYGHRSLKIIDFVTDKWDQ